MTFTYSLSDNVGKVRLLIPDTDATGYELSDEEITQFLTWRGNVVNAAAVMACEHLARKYAARLTFSEAGLSVDNSQRAEVYAKRAKELAAQVGGSMSTVTLTRDDGYADANSAGEYPSKTVYIRL